MPDFNATSTELGQTLLNPPTVAGWAQGRSWITPGTLLARGNFAREAVMPDMIDFVDPNLLPDPEIRRVNARILGGMNITEATTEREAGKKMASPAAANLLSDKDEFNTRYASYMGFQEAVRKVKPTLRDPAQFSLTGIVMAEGARTTGEAVDLLLKRFLAVQVDEEERTAVIAFLNEQIGTSDLERARSCLEEPLRMAAHLIMSAPEYQLA
ncbi:MAG: DUF1800 family protein [Acetobacteraceae bacterium]|nr:DUF1800 family protein [Acetobacteraceae bacterium]